MDIETIKKAGTQMAGLLLDMQQNIGNHVADSRPFTSSEYLALIQVIDVAVAGWQSVIVHDNEML